MVAGLWWHVGGQEQVDKGGKAVERIGRMSGGLVGRVRWRWVSMVEVKQNKTTKLDKDQKIYLVSISKKIL